MPELIELSNGTRLTKTAIEQLMRHCSCRRLAKCLGVSYIELMEEYAKHSALGDDWTMADFREHVKSIQQ